MKIDKLFNNKDTVILHSVPMGTILRIKEKKKTKSVLEVYCKDGRCLLLFFNSLKDRPIVVDAITKYAFPSSCHQLFAFVHKMFIGNDNVSSNKLETPIYFDTERGTFIITIAHLLIKFIIDILYNQTNMENYINLLDCIINYYFYYSYWLFIIFL